MTLQMCSAAIESRQTDAVAIKSNEVYERYMRYMRYMRYLTGCAELFAKGYADVRPAGTSSRI